MTKAVTLLSGGVDSAVALAMALEEHDEILALSISYGQKHREESHHAFLIAEHYDIEFQQLKIPNIFGRESTIMEGGPANPQLTYEELSKLEGPSPTVVPFRNGIFISYATAVAWVNKARWVYAGMHAEDARNWAYPDCTPEFLGAMANAVRVGSYDNIRLVTPFQWMTKAQVVAEGLRLDVPFQLTMSCYEGVDPACGVCPTCVSRLAAFKENGVEDPIGYVATDT